MLSPLTAKVITGAALISSSMIFGSSASSGMLLRVLSIAFFKSM